jgi:release factor glutamine methyltransferase
MRGLSLREFNSPFCAKAIERAITSCDCPPLLAMSKSIAHALSEAAATLNHSGVPDARKEAAALLIHVLDVDKAFLIRNSEDVLDHTAFMRFRTLVERRATGEPAQYITGYQDFYGRRFEVNPDVLIPRPETELLVENALLYVPSVQPAFSVCDVGTGSGCIAITILCERPLAHAIGLDISEAALKLAGRNAKAHGVNDRVWFAESDCFRALAPETSFDLIISNPPYVSANVLPGLQREVRDHEPLVALSPGEDGITIIRRLLVEAPAFLKPRGYLLIEIGFDQSAAVRDLVDPNVWQLVDIAPDLQQIPRIVVLRKLPDTHP